MPKKTNLEFESTSHSSTELTTDGTKQCSENTPATQGDILHMIERAAQSGSPQEMLECFNQLIHTENKVNQESLDQGLLLSCRYGREFLVKILIFHGANIETRDKDGNTPLLICAEKSFTDIALLLVDKGADINSYNKDVVEFRGNHKEVNVSILPELLKNIQQSGREITEQNLSIIKALLKAGAPLNSHYRGNNQPLVAAVKLGSYDLVEMFCQLKDVSSRKYLCYGHSTPLALAAEKGRCDIINLLIQNGKAECDKSSALESSIKHGQIDCAKLLIKYGAKIEKTLKNIVRNNRVESFLFLKEHFPMNVIMMIKSKGPEFLNLALCEGHKEIIKLLVQGGADLNASYDCKTPLMSAVDVNVMEFLIDIGADVNAKVDYYGNCVSVLEFVLKESEVESGFDYLVKKSKVTFTPWCKC
ncbi:ankyrin repeat and KH domain-containing protein 1-like [Physella acuta]|uniref:ankyrin repeat and KH domain-containing protein 1-like n=1 Tax=Physella acuta TaxID=109671 RepID=UPI0027DB1FC7|nr:ankyrin repeat and KH domain-containing protein 1-like [Physella acuta]